LAGNPEEERLSDASKGAKSIVPEEAADCDSPEPLDASFVASGGGDWRKAIYAISHPRYQIFRGLEAGARDSWSIDEVVGLLRLN
jgi:hypothetical protein